MINRHQVALAIQRAWDVRFTRPINDGLDYQQAAVAVDAYEDEAAAQGFITRKSQTINVDELANELWNRLPDDRSDADASDLAEGLRDVLKRWQGEGLAVKVEDA